MICCTAGSTIIPIREQYGRWVIEHAIGSGAHGYANLAREDGLEANPLRVIKVHKRADMIQNVVEAQSKFDHPNVLRLIDYDLELQYTVSEYCELGNLTHRVIKEWFTDEGRFELYKGISEGIRHILEKGYHKKDNIMSNIFLKKREGKIIPVIGDFDNVLWNTLLEDPELRKRYEASEMRKVAFVISRTMEDQKWRDRLREYSLRHTGLTKGFPPPGYQPERG